MLRLTDTNGACVDTRAWTTASRQHGTAQGRAASQMRGDSCMFTWLIGMVTDSGLRPLSGSHA